MKQLETILNHLKQPETQLLTLRGFDACVLLTTGVTVANTMDPLRGKESSKTNHLKQHQTTSNRFQTISNHFKQPQTTSNFFCDNL